MRKSGVHDLTGEVIKRLPMQNYVLVSRLFGRDDCADSNKVGDRTPAFMVLDVFDTAGDASAAVKMHYSKAVDAVDLIVTTMYEWFVVYTPTPPESIQFSNEVTNGAFSALLNTRTDGTTAALDDRVVLFLKEAGLYEEYRNGAPPLHPPHLLPSAEEREPELTVTADE